MPRIEVVRPDDLLNLEIETVNLRLDTEEEPALVLEDPELPARLSVTFPPQTIAETAYFESSKVGAATAEILPDGGRIGAYRGGDQD